jgi:hypothetical protein
MSPFPLTRNVLVLTLLHIRGPIPLAARFKEWVCSRSLAGTKLRIPLGTWKCVCCEFCVLSGRGLRVGLITRPGESYRLWFVWAGLWSLDNEEVLTHEGLLRHGRNIEGVSGAGKHINLHDRTRQMENTVWMRRTWRKKEEVIDEWRTLHYYELHNEFSL